MGRRLPRWGDLSKNSKITFLMVLAPSIIISVLESILAAIIMPVVAESDLEPDNDLGSIPTYLVLFVCAQIYHMYFITDGLLQKNTIQIMAQVGLSACTAAYGFFQIGQYSEAVNELEIERTSIDLIIGILWAIPVTAVVFTLLQAFMAFKLYCEFGWRVFKKIGADPHMKKIYRAYQVLIMILKLDFFFGSLFSIQYLVLVLEPNDVEFGLTIAALPGVVLLLMLAVAGLRRENRMIMWGFLAMTIALCAYFVFKLVRMHTEGTEPRLIDGVLYEIDKYQGSRRYLTLFGAITVSLIILTFINSIICYRNFDKGLKQHVASRREPRAMTAAPPSTHSQAGLSNMEDRQPSGFPQPLGPDSKTGSNEPLYQQNNANPNGQGPPPNAVYPPIQQQSQMQQQGYPPNEPWMQQPQQQQAPFYPVQHYH